MNFDRNEEQELIAASIARFIARDYTFEMRRRILASPEGYSEDVWRAMAELGLLGVTLPAEHGGLGGGAIEAMSLMDGIGDALVLEPWLATIGMGGQFIARAGGAERREEMLPAIIEGRVKLAVAYAEDDSRHALDHITTRARPEGDAYLVNGTKRNVAHGDSADWLVVSVRTAGDEADRTGVTLLLVPRDAPGVTLRPLRMLDGTRGADVTFRDVRVPLGATIGTPHEALPLLEEVIDFATALICAEAVGAIRSANAATLEYLKTRRQFGVPIGSFQALQHRMVDMVIEQEQALSMSSLACSAVDHAVDPVARARTVSLAKVRIADACRHVAQESVQLHGGMGMSDELKVSHTFRRLTAIAQQFGDADHHLARLARLEKQ